MKIFFYSRGSAGATAEALERCVAEAVYNGAEVVRGNREVTQADADGGAVMVSVGGDGTFLEAVRTLRGLPVPIVGVNTGRMGFLAQIPQRGVERAMADVCAGRFEVGRRAMLAVSGDFGAQRPEFPCALNEFTIHRHTADMVEVATSVDGELLAVIRGDGAIASTPTGSTAYALSAGGPIVSPECGCLVCLGIAPHNFSVRPLVLPDTSTVTFEVRTRRGAAMASIDNRSFTVPDGARFEVKKSEFSVFLMRVQNISFYDTLRDRTMWGIDRRDKN